MYLPKSHGNSRKQNQNSSGDQEHGLSRIMICTEIGPDHGHIEQRAPFEYEASDINLSMDESQHALSRTCR